LIRSRRRQCSILGRESLEKKAEYIHGAPVRVRASERDSLDVARTVEGEQPPPRTLLLNYMHADTANVLQKSPIGNSIALVLGFRLRMYLEYWMVLRERPSP
jgi:hypothetical protein